MDTYWISCVSNSSTSTNSQVEDLGGKVSQLEAEKKSLTEEADGLKSVREEKQQVSAAWHSY